MRGEKNMTNDIPKINTKSFIVSFDFEGEDIENCIAVIGTRKDGRMEIVNAMQGQDALDLYFKITGEKNE